MSHRWNRVAILLLVICGFSGSACLAMDVAERGQAFLQLAVSGDGVDAAGKLFQSGHLALSFTAGRLYPLRVDGAVVGAFFAGQGTFRYVSADPLELAVFRTNAERVSRYRVDTGGGIGDPVESVLILTSGDGAVLFDGTAPPESAAGCSGAEAFARHQSRFAEDQGLSYPQLMAQARLETISQPVIVAEIKAQRNDLRYVFDPLISGREWISVMNKLQSRISFLKDRRYDDELSIQPIGRKRLEPFPQRFRLSSVDLTLVNPMGFRAELEAVETFQIQSPLRTLGLRLWSRRMGTSGASGTPDEHEYVLHSVQLDSGEAAPFFHQNNYLVVQLPRTYAAGESVVLKFKASGDVLFRPGNDNYWELGTAPWYPMPHRLEMQAFTYHAVCKVAKPFVPFTNGQTIRQWEEQGLNCAEFREEKPVQLPVILAGKYRTYSETRAGLTISVSSYAMANDMATKKLANLTFGFLDFYRPYLGDFPFRELKLIELNDYGYGQAPSGIVFITQEAFTPMQDDLSKLFSEGINARLAHEIAHQWWGDVALLGADEDQWISESVAEYYSAVAMGHLRDKADFDKAIHDWKSGSSPVKEKGTIYLANQLSGEKGWDDRIGLLYNKGPLVLHALRQEIGDDAFFIVLKAFLKNFQFKCAETRHFIGLTNFVTKKDYTSWFDQYLLGTAWPAK